MRGASVRRQSSTRAGPKSGNSLIEEIGFAAACPCGVFISTQKEKL